jgi:hypothetical protein
MGDYSDFGFAKLVPGFDFLQSLAKGATQNIAQLPSLSNWVAPTLNIEELDKRITELKAVHFWLDQNGKALAATIQALEVQKMTLATLQGMNFKMADVANSLKLRTAETMAGDVEKASEAAAATARKAPSRSRATTQNGEDATEAPAEGAAAAVDPMQWWGALTQQFQQIAAGAMQDVAQKTAAGAANLATATAKEVGKAPKKAPARKAPARKRRTTR